MIWLLLILLSITVCINYKMADLDIFNPAVIVSSMFCIFAFLCGVSNIFIGIDIKNEATIIVIMLGMSIFTIFNYFTHNRQHRIKKIDQTNINIPAIWGIIGICCTSMTIYVNYNYIIDFASAYGVGGDFFESMVKYKIIMTFHDADDILVNSPWYRGGLMAVSSCFAYLAIYIFMQKKVLCGKVDLIYSTNILLYILLSFMGGGRSEVFRIITAAMFMWYIFYRTKQGNNFNVKKVLVKFAFIMSLVSLAFIGFVFIVGRTNADLDFEYIIMALFIYAGAPIFNLDIYLDNPWQQTHGLFGEITFIKLINWIGQKFGVSSLVYEYDLPFLSYQNYNLGNVYTTFYAFTYDFGLVGVVVLTGIMAAICIWLYNKVKASSIIEYNISFIVICYAYLVNDLIMLSFSNRFYETIANIGTLCRFVFLYILVHIANNVRIMKIHF